jgi:hypothetical protein
LNAPSCIERHQLPFNGSGQPKDGGKMPTHHNCTRRAGTQERRKLTPLTPNTAIFPPVIPPTNLTHLNLPPDSLPLDQALEFAFRLIEYVIEAIWGRTLRQSLPIQAVPND